MALQIPVTEKDHYLGRLDAPIVLVEYGDYQCPFCRAAHAVVQSMIRRGRDQPCFVFRNFPLRTIHPHAEHAALAAEAAGRQGKFWEMHDTLFENQLALDVPHLIMYAEGLSIDPQRFVRDMEDSALLLRVREDVKGGLRSGVNGTPTFFVGGLRYDGPFELLPEAIGLGSGGTASAPL
jgi:protein-disulfide isomerase